MKIALLGGGGFRTPQISAALLAAAPRLEVDELALYDVTGPGAAPGPTPHGLSRDDAVAVEGYRDSVARRTPKPTRTVPVIASSSRLMSGCRNTRPAVLAISA